MRTNLRTIAVIAHVDHGKTTLVDAMLKQTGALAGHRDHGERVMDSGDLEKEKGITITAKVAEVTWNGTRIQLADTPGHADFGGEVERALHLVDGALLLVDASEGPLPQTRYVLHKCLKRRLPVVVCLNKVDRPDARFKEVLDEVYGLFIDLDATEDQIEFPVIYAIAREGKAGTSPDNLEDGLGPLMDAIVNTVPPPTADPDGPLRIQITNLAADDFVGRLGLGLMHSGRISEGDRVLLMREGEPVGQAMRITKLLRPEGIGLQQTDTAEAGDIVALAGLGEILVGDSVCDPENPQPLPGLHVDQPSLSMEFGINTSPLNGREGKFLTARQLKARLEREALGNVSVQIQSTDSPDRFEVQGRGELQLAVLIEQMRREGFELEVSKPQVITKEVDGEIHEPYEHVTVDVPQEFVGIITEQLSLRKGRMTNLSDHQSGWVRLEFKIPARGLIGLRTQMLTDTRGTAIIHHVFDTYGPWAGVIKHRIAGVLVSDRTGSSTPHALGLLQERGELFIPPGVDVYEGMIVGENARPDDLDVNATRAKEKTNIRTHSHDEAPKLAPPRILNLEQALEFLSSDELLELTPTSIRLRKRTLDGNLRRRENKREKRGETPA